MRNGFLRPEPENCFTFSPFRFCGILELVPQKNPIFLWHKSTKLIKWITLAVSENLNESSLCWEHAISLHTHHDSLVQWTTRLFPVMRDPGSIPREVLWETGILLLALSRYIGDPDMIDNFCGLVWSRLRPEWSLGHCTDNVIISLDLTQLFCPGFMLPAGPPSSFTTDIVAAGGEPCREPAISLNSHHVSLVQWTTRLLPVMRDLGSPRGVLMWNRDSPINAVSLHLYGLSPSILI
jgi:hypothetical protein